MRLGASTYNFVAMIQWWDKKQKKTLVFLMMQIWDLLMPSSWCMEGKDTLICFTSKNAFEATALSPVSGESCPGINLICSLIQSMLIWKYINGFYSLAQDRSLRAIWEYIYCMNYKDMFISWTFSYSLLQIFKYHVTIAP